MLTKGYDDLTSGLDYQINQHYTLGAVAKYDLNQASYEEFATTLEIDYDNFKYDTAMQIDLNTGQLKRWDNSLELKLGPSDWQWQISLNSSYDQLEQKFREANLTLEKMLHKRKLSLSYDHLQGEVWFQYQLLAFPNSGVKVGSNDNEGMLFGGELGRLLDE
ncbi:hypothetical protein Halha_2432 [Halobacteroides halobius DSM 5150]|uniref:Uncharacterized protein n=1 Tax=Halobacteroides halobius (strain ATCC 35273 / DSM 5150 / MD-1) TaxID=748449 RepID=L0KBD9_HALHC|nr:hypothetical protein [Halobacteroides halobius]AGB42306.1 hypothetical protein Halha_2432 [Halobacteroides halobius DSM 5150]